MGLKTITAPQRAIFQKIACAIFFGIQSFAPAIPLLEIYSEDTLAKIQKDTCTKLFITGQFVIMKDWSQLRYSSVRDELSIHLQNGALCSCNKEGGLSPFVAIQ